MAKVAITFGEFDCLNASHFNLIKEMRKISMPDNKLVVVIPDDYVAFASNGFFPIQELEHRMRNIKFLVDKAQVCLSEDPTNMLDFLIDSIKKSGDRPIYVCYEENKNFIGKNAIEKHKIPMRIIKKYGQTKNN